MTSDKQQDSVLKACTVEVQEPKVLEIYRADRGDAYHPKYYTTTLYRKDGKLNDPDISKDDEATYWDAFVEHNIAVELQRRLDIVESPDYVPGSIEWDAMKVEGTNGKENKG